MNGQTPRKRATQSYRVLLRPPAGTDSQLPSQDRSSRPPGGPRRRPTRPHLGRRFGGGPPPNFGRRNVRPGDRPGEGSVKKIRDADFKDLWTSYRAKKTPEVKSKLIEAYFPLVRYIAERLAST